MTSGKPSPWLTRKRNKTTELTIRYTDCDPPIDKLPLKQAPEKSLSHRFKARMNCNISDYIFTCKMNHACALLRSTDMTVTEIAGRVGYTQYTSFVRQFKRECGVTPSVYRDAWRGGNGDGQTVQNGTEE